MTSSILRGVVAATAVLGLGAAAHAAIIDYTLIANGAATGGANTWGLYASIDNSSGVQATGLASFKVTLKTTSVGGGPISSLSNQSPKVTYTDSSGTNSDDPVGFLTVRSSNSITATGTPVTGSIDTVDAGVTIAYGIGLSAGSLPAMPAGYDGASSPLNVNYGLPVLLAKGNFTGSPDGNISTWFNTTTGANNGNVFLNTTDVSTASANGVVLAVQGIGAAVPEPASLGVLALGGVALLGRRRKA